MRRTLLFLLFVLLLNSITTAQTTKPMQMPVAAPAGPSTWLLGQPYGNTTGAYNNGRAWYSAGQGLHFGIDLSMPCGTELVAVADAEVAFVDDMGFGSAPHNLILRHPALGLTTLYGHLLETPALTPGQFVRKGEVVALSGDPDSTCESRPHLHLEVRSLDYRTALNPVDYIDAPWHMLTTIGSFGSSLFQQDMFNARQWMRIDNQPQVGFGGRILNEYISTWPPPRGQDAPPNPPLPRDPAPLPADVSFTMHKLGYDGCCFGPWWHPSDPDRLYAVDGVPGAPATIFEWTLHDGIATNTQHQGPRPLLSPDGTHEVLWQADQALIRRLADGAEWPVQTGGALPAISAGSSHLFWEARSETVLPGQPDAITEFWVSTLTGENPRQILAQPGGSARWLDDHRLLVSTPLEGRQTMLSVFDLRDDSSYTLGVWPWMRGLDIGPGGERLLFYLTRNPDPALNGVYTIETRPGAEARQLDWFGGWRWRDASSVYYIPFDPTTDRQSLVYYDLLSGESRQLIDGSTHVFVTTGGDWAVSADGKRVVFLNAPDNSLWIFEENPAENP